MERDEQDESNGTINRVSDYRGWDIEEANIEARIAPGRGVVAHAAKNRGRRICGVTFA